MFTNMIVYVRYMKTVEVLTINVYVILIPFHVSQKSIFVYVMVIQIIAIQKIINVFVKNMERRNVKNPGLDISSTESFYNILNSMFIQPIT